MFDLAKISDNAFFGMTIVIFLIGFWIMLSHANLIKKIIGMNIMESAIFLFFVAIGYIKGGVAPIGYEAENVYVNPLPSALILTGIVVSVSITAFALGLVVKLYQHYGTVNIDEIVAIRRNEE